MPKKEKVQIVDRDGKVVSTATLKTKVETINGIPVDPTLEKPLISVTVTNPFKKVLYWLDQIRRRQTTTLAFKLSIPLIALPVIIAGIFSLGRLSGISFQKFQQVQKPLASTAPAASAAPSINLSRAGTLKIAKSATKTTYLLALRNGTLVNLEVPDYIDLTKYQNKQILVTGSYNSTTGVLTVTDIAEIEVFNSLEITSTPSAN